MEKEIIRSPLVPETGGPFNLAIRHRDMIYISGLPPFQEEFCQQLREARRTGQPLPAMPDLPMEDQICIVMNHLKWLMEAAGSNMDCLLKVVVWLKDQNQMGAFDKIYRSYFSSDETMPTRTRIQAGRTPFDCALEIDAIGYVPKAINSPSR
ncbi:RidA family protein [Diaphorobacter sp. JS3051]|uniref:RidA family protein n=1 Tax=Diaphorobacter sp. JS3051 TaxID=2792224 RepID=UPI0018C8EE79|nr:RidA family protein [Diaphorobacter sp. JS3051]QPN32327.1 RidA family protein [Diaphorobacter sp. JS3051]